MCLALLPALSVRAAAQSAQPWPQADRLFRSDRHWLGGDGAFSIDLGEQRVLWLFGDSFIGSKPRDTRQHSVFIRNSAAIETGYDPEHATIKFYTGLHGRRIADFAESPEPGRWLWPMHGIALDHRLLLFYVRLAIDPRKHSLGFQSVSWNAFLISNPDEPPSYWRFREIPAPLPNGKKLIGISLLDRSGFVYAFVQDDRTHNGYLLRWRDRDAAKGQLEEPQWWCGPAGWQQEAGCEQIVIPDSGSEFSVQAAPDGHGFVEVNSAGFGATTIVWRHAQRLEGPWSRPEMLYFPPESRAPDAFVYAAKLHPELRGGDLIITYVANSMGPRVLSDMNLYFPRFVRVRNFPSGSIRSQP